MDITEPRLEDYCRRHSDPPNALMEELATVTKQKMTDYGMQVGPLEGAFLKMLAKLAGAKRILEVGMFTGYSALCMAEALPDDGELITCDVDPKAEAIAKSFFERSPHGKKIKVMMGDAKQTLKGLTGQFDVVFLDADKESYLQYYALALPMLRPGGLLIADNTLWSGKVLEPKKESDVAIVTFNSHVLEDKRVERVLVPVRDGMMLARKK
ncbi:MAG: class I SAM-dependent methyltransferase [Myxococcaceae bacterium]